MNKKLYIISGGTTTKIAPHLSLCAPAFGSTGEVLDDMLFKAKYANGYLVDGNKAYNLSNLCKMDIHNVSTNMAGGKQNLNTNEQVKLFFEEITKDTTTKVVILPLAVCDYYGYVVSNGNVKDHSETRLKTEDGDVLVKLIPATKLIEKIRKERKDIFLVAFKSVYDATPDEMFEAGIKLCKSASANLVFVNDTSKNFEDATNSMIVTPEESTYGLGNTRNQNLAMMLDMVSLRSNLSFTRSTVIGGERISWYSDLVPEVLRTVVNHCIKQGAYKSVTKSGATVGHFACRLKPESGGHEKYNSQQVFLTSIRRSNFNNIDKEGLVKIIADGNDHVIAFGAKPSVGGQSQRIIFQGTDLDNIVHFHCPLSLDADAINSVSQYEYECGSHQCGANTYQGLRDYMLDNGQVIKAVYIKNHGPNIVFANDVDAGALCRWIDKNFDLSKKTVGYSGGQWL